MNQPLLSLPITGLPLEVLVAVLLVFGVTALVQLLLWRTRREPFLLLWALAWAAFTLRYVPQLWGQALDLRSPLAVVGVVRDLCFLAGASLYAGRRWWRWCVPPLLLEAALVLAGSLRHPEFGGTATMVRLLVAGLALGSVAVVLATSSRPAHKPRRLSIVGILILVAAIFVLPVLGSDDVMLLGILMQLGALATVLGLAIAELEETSAERVAALRRLEGTMQHAIRGQANVCVDCDRVESTGGIWRAPEAFVLSATNAQVTHGICPACADREFGVDISDVQVRAR